MTFKYRKSVQYYNTHTQWTVLFVNIPCQLLVLQIHLGGFMYADSRTGTVGQETYLYTIEDDFGSDTCLTFWLYLYESSRAYENTRLR